jgi:hypothetical protein
MYKENSMVKKKNETAAKKAGRKNTTGVTFPNSSRAYKSLNHQEKKKFLTYQKEYVKNHYRTYLIRMNAEEDADIIAWLEGHDNMSDCIRECVAAARNRELKKSAKK